MQLEAAPDLATNLMRTAHACFNQHKHMTKPQLAQQQQTAHLHILSLEVALLPAPLRFQPQMQVNLRMHRAATAAVSDS
jgi:hypothetical protein